MLTTALNKIYYLYDINWQQIGKRSADVSTRDMMFAHILYNETEAYQ